MWYFDTFEDDMQPLLGNNPRHFLHTRESGFALRYVSMPRVKLHYHIC